LLNINIFFYPKNVSYKRVLKKEKIEDNFLRKLRQNLRFGKAQYLIQQQKCATQEKLHSIPSAWPIKKE